MFYPCTDTLVIQKMIYGCSDRVVTREFITLDGCKHDSTFSGAWVGEYVQRPMLHSDGRISYRRYKLVGYEVKVGSLTLRYCECSETISDSTEKIFPTEVADKSEISFEDHLQNLLVAYWGKPYSALASNVVQDIATAHKKHMPNVLMEIDKRLEAEGYMCIDGTGARGLLRKVAKEHGFELCDRVTFTW